MTTNTTNVLILTQKAEVKVGKINLGNDTTLQLKHIQVHLKKKTEIEALGTYAYKQYTLFLFGYTKGRAGSENKHELPPPHDTTLAFGDIILVASKNENSFAQPVTFKVEDYETFYSRAFGGFEDLDEDELEEDEVEEEEVVEEEVLDVIDAEETEDTFEIQSYVSEEEIVQVKKEKKKKASASSNINVSQFIHPDKQLNESSVPNTIRIKTLESLTKIFTNILSDDECYNLEYSIYKAVLNESEKKHIIKDWTIVSFVQLYKMYVRRIIGNLSSSSYVNNTELIQRYKSKEVIFDEICNMDHYSLYQSKWNERIEHQKLIEKRQIEGNKSMATDLFLCTRCYKRECTYYEMQTRSADEPMTRFISCLNCGKNWRE